MGYSKCCTRYLHLFACPCNFLAKIDNFFLFRTIILPVHYKNSVTVQNKYDICYPKFIGSTKLGTFSHSWLRLSTLFRIPLYIPAKVGYFIPSPSLQKGSEDSVRYRVRTYRNPRELGYGLK